MALAELPPTSISSCRETSMLAGWPQDVEAVGRKELHAFHQQHYRPSNVTIAVVGDVDPARVRSAGPTSHICLSLQHAWHSSPGVLPGVLRHGMEAVRPILPSLAAAAVPPPPCPAPAAEDRTDPRTFSTPQHSPLCRLRRWPPSTLAAGVQATGHRTRLPQTLPWMHPSPASTGRRPLPKPPLLAQE